MSRKYKFSDQDKLYFVSFAVIYWIDFPSLPSARPFSQAMCQMALCGWAVALAVLQSKEKYS